MIHIVRQWEGGNITGVCAHLTRHRLPFHVLEAWRDEALPPLRRGDALIVLGGPPSVCGFHDDHYPVSFLRREALWLDEAHRLGVFTLGICLGHQLLGVMRTHSVRSGALVFGIEDVETTSAGHSHWLFSGLPRRLRVYQHHCDAVSEVGSGVEILATSPTCAIESAAWDDRVVSVQFHPEVLRREMPGILGRHETLLAAQGQTLDAMLAAVPADYESVTGRMFDNFLHRAGCIERPSWIARIWKMSVALVGLRREGAESAA